MNDRTKNLQSESTPRTTSLGPPAANFSFKELLPTLVFDVLLPMAIFNLLSAAKVPTLWALVAGGLSPALYALSVFARTRRVEPLGIIVLVFLAVGALASVVSGNVLFAEIKDSFLTGAFGILFLGSLLTRRPMMFYITRQFVAGPDPSRRASWDELWDIPGFRADQRFVTAVWGVTYLAEAALRVVFALTLPPSSVANLSPVLTFGALVGLVVWTRGYMKGRAEKRMASRTVLHPAE